VNTSVMGRAIDSHLKAQRTAQTETFTPKAMRVQELRAEGKSFDEAFAIADREFTLDGLLPRRGTADLDAVLSGGIQQTGQVQF
jgi:hypothetical protein